MRLLSLDIEVGVTSRVLLSPALHLHKALRPHIAEVVLVPGTQYFRNIHRYN